MTEDNMCDLAKKECVPCQGGTPPLQGEELGDFYRQLHEDWELMDDHHLIREFDFDDFKQALDFTIKVGELAEKEGHHPDMGLGWGYVYVTTYTHKIDGLTESDFVLAAKIDQLMN